MIQLINPLKLFQNDLRGLFLIQKTFFLWTGGFKNEYNKTKLKTHF